MTKLPESDWLALSESARRATRAFGAERVAVETALVAAFHDGKIFTRGRCRSWFGHDTLIKFGKYTWDKANVRWQVNEFTVPGNSPSSHRTHTFSDVEVHREDLEKWINGAVDDSQYEPQGPTEIAVPEEPEDEPAPPRKKPTIKPRRRGGRKKGSGSFAAKDKPLLELMKPLIAGGKAEWAAAMSVVGKAAGHGLDESKAKRLVARYREWEKNNSE